MVNGQIGSRVLSFDIGNSRIKWAIWEAGKHPFDDITPAEITDKGAVLSTVDSLRALVKQLSGSYQTLDKILAVNVAGEAVEGILKECVSQAWAKEVRFLRTAASFSSEGRSLINAYSNPASHGADRWAGLIAASHEFSGALCVMSAGTAITFDLLEADGRHLGGRILPSMQTVAKAMLADAAAINVKPSDIVKSVEEKVPALFDNNTQGAISSGVYYLLVAGLREACGQAKEMLSQPPTFIITGGGAEQLMRWLQMPEIKHRPDLILQGVYIALNKGEG